jgi:hypothetical protein
MSKIVALVFGIVFVVVGLLGFVPNPIVGPGALFDTNLVHDLIHLVFGLILLFVAWKAPAKSGLWLLILGIVYLVVALLGFVLTPNGGLLLGLVETNTTDHWLHVVLGVVLVLFGLMGGKGMKSMPAATSMPTSNPSM